MLYKGSVRYELIIYIYIYIYPSRIIRWAEHVARVAASGGAYSVLVGKLDGKKPLERHRFRYDDNIKMSV